MFVGSVRLRLPSLLLSLLALRAAAHRHSLQQGVGSDRVSILQLHLPIVQPGFPSGQQTK
jgi:hypothetical protein